MPEAGSAGVGASRSTLRTMKWIVPLIIVAASAALFFVYYFVYVSWQRQYAHERALRLLAVAGDQVQKRFANLRNIFAAALVEPAEKQKKGKPADVADYLINVADMGAEALSDVKARSPCPGTWWKTREGQLTLTLDRNDQPGTAALRAEFDPRGVPAHSCSLSALVTPAAEFRERIHRLTEDYFDDVVLATAAGDVLFDSPSVSGLHVTNLSGLLPAPNSSPSKTELAETEPSRTAYKFRHASQFSNVLDVKLSGAAYKLYIQPTPLPIFPVDAASKNKDKLPCIETMMCGLVRADRIESEVVSIPYSTLIWGTLIVLTIFGFAWPLVKMASISPAERLRRRHVFWLVFAALFVTTMLAVIVLNTAYTVIDHQEAHQQLDSLAGRIDDNVKTELAQALALMNTLGLDKDAMRSRVKTFRPEDWTVPRFLQTENYKNLKDPYPYMDYLFWLDKDGQEIYKLTARTRPTPRTVITASYFKDVQQGLHLIKIGNLVLSGGKTVQDVPSGTACIPFHFEPVYSPNTGQYFVVLSKQFTGNAKQLPKSMPGVEVQVLAARFASLVETVVPAGYGYALVDHEGMVQFHSVAGRSQVENFFQECRENPVLKSLVAHGQKDFVDVDYMGRQQLMLVRPLTYLSDPPLTLVVFRDHNYFAAIHVACMLVFAFLAIVLSLPFLAGAAYYISHCANYPLANVWPSSTASETYLKILAAALCLGTAFAIRFPKMNALQMVIAIVAITVVMALVGFVRPKWVGALPLAERALVLAAIVAVALRSWALLAAGAYLALCLPAVSKWLNRQFSPKRDFQSLYLAVACALLAVTAVLPCFGLFKLSYDEVNRMAAESAQFDRLDLLARRHIRLKQTYIREDRIGLENRIQDRRDRYDEAVFCPSAKPTDAGCSQEKLMPRRPSRLEQWFAWVVGGFPGRDLGAKMRAALLEDTGEQPPQWEYGANHNEELLRLPEPDEQIVPGGKLCGVFPRWRLPWLAVLVLLLVTPVLIMWLNHMIRRVFLTDLEPVPQLPNWAPCDEKERCLLILGPPKSGKSKAAKELGAVDTIDLAKVIAGGPWTPPPFTERTVVVDHFEFDIDNPDSCHAKLHLLERLLYVDQKRVIVLSAVDPMFYFAESSPELMTTSEAHEPPSQMLDRWAQVLSKFVKLTTEDCTEIELYASHATMSCPKDLVSLVQDECKHTPQLRRIGRNTLRAHLDGATSRAALFEELMDRADSYYRVQWSTCTKRERLVLFQLARDGWANPKNARAIQQLERRRLVCRAPGLRIMNETFRRFVLTAQLPSEVARWAEEEQHSAWSVVRLGLGTAALTAGAWLIYAQQDVFQMGLGYIAALTAAGGAVLKLAHMMTGQKTNGDGAPEGKSN